MIHRRLEEEVERVAIRLRRLHAWTALATVWFATALVGAVALALAWRAGWVPAWVVLTLTGTGALAAFVVVMFTTRSARNVRSVARRIETQHPDLDSVLLVAVEQQPDLPGGQFSFLKASVVHEALAHCQRRDWGSAVSEGRIRTARFASAAAVFLLATTIGGLWSISARGMPEGSLRFDDDVVLSIQQSDVEVLPGDTAIERGTSLIVTARFGGDPPDDATLVYRDASGAAERVPMSLSLSDPIFGARVANVQSELAYHVEYARSKTRIYRATVFVYPQLMRADAILTFPEYTTLSVKHIEDVRRITAVEGTEITLVCHLNKPVASATLVDEDGNVTELVADAEVPTTYSVSQTPKESGRYKLHLVDAEGRKNQDPAEFVFNVTPNQRPDVIMAMPAGDTRVSPIEELATKANVWDDYGLRAYGISYSFGDDESREINLGEATGRNERRDVAHLVDFESLDAEPDQLLAYHFWAEDIGPDGELRRTLGDLYFAEVRHFEEIFREGQQPPGGAGQGQQGGPRQSQELMELQKQIVSATWTVIRRETPGRPTEDFIPDSRDLQGSQQLAVDQAQALAKEIEDADAAEYLAVAEGHMKDAVVELTKVVESTSIDALGPALAAERSAYQALLKLLAREFEVTRGNPQGGSGSATGRQNRSQRQLDQLELSDADNRYETQRQSSQRQDQATDENREMLSRLRDLARRQADLNKRLRELQSALEEATTNEEREEIERQLKRLRDQEQQLLRDTDELNERIERTENQERMAESQQDLQEIREKIRQTTEALEKGQLSRAITEGTRAERELKEMREKFRKAAASQFTEEAKQLRDDARRLDENEKDLAERLQNLDRTESRRLRDTNDREEIVEGFRRQGEDLERLLNDMKDTVEAAEEAEPLLSSRLYDTLRRTRQKKLDEALDVTRTMLDLGVVNEAKSAERLAGEGIDQLRQDVEKAAESVLGDEDEALRRAHQTLQDLAEELAEEIERAGGQGQGQPNQRPNQSELRQSDNTSEPGGARMSGGQQRTDPDAWGGRGGGLSDLLEGARTRRGPIDGEDFRDWSDRLRDVEEMIDDAELRAEAARIRDRARGIRREAREPLPGREFVGPNWDVVIEFVAEPLNELRDRVAEELLRRGTTETMVPLDRDPVPTKYAEPVRRYLEQLGTGQ